MKIQSIDIFRYDLPLRDTLRIKDIEIDRRTGLLCRMTDEEGHSGWGEVAPLPGFSLEDIGTASTELLLLKKALTGANVPDSIESLSGGFEKWLGQRGPSPSVRCGMEMAVLNLIAENRGSSLAGLLSKNPVTDFRVNRLITQSDEQAITQIRDLASEGYQSVKLKIGRGLLEDDITFIRTLFAVLPFGVAVRLDANRAWTTAEAERFAAGIVGSRIEYVEEPLQDNSEIPALIRETALPVAVDETLRETSPEKFQLFDGLKAIVLKPTLMGGFEICRTLSQKANEAGVKVVISSSFETSVGLSALAHFVASLGDRQTAHGLDTARLFAEDVLPESIPVTAGRIHLDRLPPVADIDVSRLDEIESD